MSKRAEEAALKAYPPETKKAIELLPRDWNKPNRTAFIQGYERAEKDLGWHSVDECLPLYDEEVIVLSDKIGGSVRFSANYIGYGHRPNPERWNGRNIENGKVEHYNVKTYNGWNIPGVHHWMYCPKLPEDFI